MMILPTEMKREGQNLPRLNEDDARYVMAENGIFLERSTPMFTTSVEVRRFDLGLAEHHQYCQLRCGKIPIAMQRMMLGFFQYVHDVHGAPRPLAGSGECCPTRHHSWVASS